MGSLHNGRAAGQGHDGGGVRPRASGENGCPAVRLTGDARRGRLAAHSVGDAQIRGQQTTTRGRAAVAGPHPHQAVAGAARPILTSSSGAERSAAKICTAARLVSPFDLLRRSLPLHHAHRDALLAFPS